MPTITSGSSGPATGAVLVVPSNTGSALAGCRALYVGTAGDISGISADGGAVLFAGVPAGTIFPMSFSRVNVTGTTAGQMWALF